MKFRREPPSEQMHYKVQAPLHIEVDGQAYCASSWSMDGFIVEDFAGQDADVAGTIRTLKPDVLGREFECLVHIPFQGFDISFATLVKIDRFTKTGAVEASFVELGEREQDILSFFAEELIRGSMTVIDDVILHLDRPITPVSTKSDSEPVEAVCAKKWPLRTVLMTALYAIIGVGVLAYIGLIFNNNFYQLEIETAVVSAPIQPIWATADGRIGKVLGALQKAIVTKTPLFVIENAKLEEAIDRAKVEVNRRTMLLLAKQKELKAEQERLKDYRVIIMIQLEQVVARRRALQKQMMMAERQVKRYRTLIADGWTTQAKLEEGLGILAGLRGQLEQIELEVKQKQASLEHIAKGQFFSGKKIEGRIKEIQAEVDLKWEQIVLAKDELLALERHRDRLTILAPVDGRVVKLLRQPGSNIKKGEQIAIYERNEAREIIAFLTQEEVLEIGFGDKAIVYFPALDQRVIVQVSNIDRTTNYIDEMRSRYQWRGLKYRAARVTLRFVNLSNQLIRKQFAAGLPAVVIFKRRNKSAITSRFSNGFTGLFTRPKPKRKPAEPKKTLEAAI